MLACKSSCLLRNRTLAVRPGFRLWAPASLYAVLFTVAGPPPRRELRRLLRSGPAVFRAASVVVDGDGDLRGSSKCLTDSSSASLALSEHDAQRAGSAADATAAQLAQGLQVRTPDARMFWGPAGNCCAVRHAWLSNATACLHPYSLCLRRLAALLQALFPDSFDQLVRVYNHKAVDLLLVKHEAAASQRDRCVTALAAARALMPAEGAKGGARAAARLARAEAQLAKWQQATELLEQQFVEARQAALSQPLGTAFIALFRWVWVWAGTGGISLARQRAQDSRAGCGPRLPTEGHSLPGPALPQDGSSGGHAVAPEREWRRGAAGRQLSHQALPRARQHQLACPVGHLAAGAYRQQWGGAAQHGAPDVARAARLFSSLPASRQARPRCPQLPQRAWRGVIIMLPLGVIMLFPIGVITGALSNLDVAVCGGTPGTRARQGQAPAAACCCGCEHAGLHTAWLPSRPPAPAGSLAPQTPTRCEAVRGPGRLTLVAGAGVGWVGGWGAREPRACVHSPSLPAPGPLPALPAATGLGTATPPACGRSSSRAYCRVGCSVCVCVCVHIKCPDPV